jgi:hypothetical protein
VTRRLRLLHRQSFCFALLLTILGLVPNHAFGWGSNGHRIIARIAMDRLSTNARQAINELLAPGETLESISGWADMVRAQRPETASWHFLAIPVVNSDYQAVRDCGPQEICIIEAIEQQTRTLRNLKAGSSERTDALKFLVHLIGDLHQPFHVSTNTNPQDRGGNLVRVTFMSGRLTNLHTVWDDDLISYTLKQSHLSISQYATQLGNKFRSGSANQKTSQASNQASSISVQGSVTDWALETHRLVW